MRFPGRGHAAIGFGPWLTMIAISLSFLGCGSDRGGWYVLRWIEQPNAHGPSATAKPEDVCAFVPCGCHDRDAGAVARDEAMGALREGDVIAYRKPTSEARREIATVHLNSVGYRMLKYGHLAIVVRDPDRPERLCLFSSESFKGPNIDEDLPTLNDHDGDAYRLDRWDRVDKGRIADFVRLAHAKAGHWYGYDFSGMLGLWNSNLTPEKPDEIGHDYICSTVVVACLWYAGVRLDAVRSQVGDVCSPYQVVLSRGALMPLPQVELVVEKTVGR